MMTEDYDDAFKRTMNIENYSRQESMGHDEVLDKIGGFGRFTHFATFIMVVAVVTGDLVVNNLAFYGLVPAYECQQLDGSW